NRSISPDLSGSNRSLADNGVYLTLVGSLKIAAATARQKSTSKPVQLPLSSGLEKPGNPWLTPQRSEPLSFTVLSVWAAAASAQMPSTKATPNINIPLFMVQPLPLLESPCSGLLSVFWRRSGSRPDRSCRTALTFARPFRPQDATDPSHRRHLRTIAHRGQG